MRSGDRIEKAPSEAAIDEALAETFPASDPLPWTLGIEQDPKAAGQPSKKPGKA